MGTLKLFPKNLDYQFLSNKSFLNCTFTTQLSFSPRMLASVLPVLTGGPRSELRSIERDKVIAELTRIYQLDDARTISVINITLGRVERLTVKAYLLRRFLFGNDHRRWKELTSMLNTNGYTH